MAVTFGFASMFLWESSLTNNSRPSNGDIASIRLPHAKVSEDLVESLNP